MAGEIPLLGLHNLPRIKSTAEQPAATFTLDIDGSTGKGPLVLLNEGFPMVAMRMVLMGKLTEKVVLTALEKGPSEKKRRNLETPSRAKTIHNQVRGLNPEVVQAVKDADTLMGIYGIGLTNLLVSGRGVGYYDVTHKQFEKNDLNLHGICLNPDRGTTAWKGDVNKVIMEHQDTAHLDDDLITAYALSLIGVLSFVLDKPYYHPVLLSRSGFKKPDNLIFVASPSDIPNHMEDRIKRGTFARARG